MGNFCGKCGSPVDTVTGKCPHCDPVAPIAQEVVMPVQQEVVTPVAQEIVTPVAQEVVTPVAQEVVTPVAREVVTPVAQETVKPAETTNMVYTEVYQPRKPRVKRKFPTKFFVLLGSGAVVAAVGIWVLFCILDHNGIVSIPSVDHFLETFGWEYQPEQIVIANSQKEETESEEEDDNKEELVPGSLEDYLMDFEDSDSIYKDKADVISKTAVNDSQTLQSEYDAYWDLSNRGLARDGVYSSWSMDGEYLYEAEIYSYEYNTKHPSYIAYYQSPTGVYWSIELINGVITATPLSFNEDEGAAITLCETDTIMTYDVATNQFFEIIPKAEVRKLHKVEQITDTVLDSMTKEALKQL